MKISYTEEELLGMGRGELVAIIFSLAAHFGVAEDDICPPRASVDLMIDSILESQERAEGSN